MIFDVRTRSCVVAIGPDIHNFKENELFEWLDDNHIVSGSKDHVIHLWNLETGECEAQSFMDGKVAALDVADGARIVVGDDTGSVQILEWATGRIAPF